MNLKDLNILKNTIRQEMAAAAFYQEACLCTEDADLRRCLKQLALEEKRHAHSLRSLLPDGGQEEMEVPSFERCPDLEALLDGALRMELDMEQESRIARDRVQDANLRSILRTNATESLQHFKLLSCEYARIFTRVPRLRLPSSEPA